MDPIKTLTLTIVIATKGRGDTIKACLNSLVSQTRLPDELIVVDQNPAPTLKPLLEKGLRDSLIPLSYLWRPELKSLPQARNVGFENSLGDIILFLDDDVELEAEYIQNLLLIYLADKKGVLGGVGGWIANESQGLNWFTHWFRRGPFRDLRDDFRMNPRVRFRSNALSGCNMSYLRSVYAANLADEKLVGYSIGEDWDIGVRVSRSHDLVLTTTARLVHHKSPLSRLTRGERMAMWIKNVAYFYSKHQPHEKRRKLQLKVFEIWLRFGLLLLVVNHWLKGRRQDALTILAQLRDTSFQSEAIEL